MKKISWCVATSFFGEMPCIYSIHNRWWYWVSLTLFTSVINGVPHYIGFIFMFHRFPSTVLVSTSNHLRFVFIPLSLSLGLDKIVRVRCIVCFSIICISFTFIRKTKVKELKSLNCNRNDRGRKKLNAGERKMA